jgi:predicted  nucleic acid-binding Zn-ribbon protein
MDLQKILLTTVISIAVAVGGEALFSWRLLPSLQSDIKAAQGDATDANKKVDDDRKVLYELTGEMKGTREDLKTNREDNRALRQLLESEIRFHSKR